MTNDISIRQKQIDFWEVFLIICLSYTFVAMLAIFFAEDLFRIFTPFLAPFFLLFIALVYLVVSIASLLYVPFRIKGLTWRVFIPAVVNFLTFLIVQNFYNQLGILRVDIGFQTNEKKFNQVANWITESIQNGELNLNETSDTVMLPKEYKNLAEDDRVWVTNKYGVISIFFTVEEDCLNMFQVITIVQTMQIHPLKTEISSVFAEFVHIGMIVAN